MKFISGMIAFGIIFFATAAGAATIYGIFGSDGLEHLVTFDSASPGSISENITLSGLVADDTLFNIAFQPSTGLLYGLGSQHLYTINTTTGAVATVGSALSQVFGGTQTGFSFDPVTGLIQIVGSSTQANLVMDPATGGITAGPDLAFGSGDANAGATPCVGGVAFSNSHAGATSTTLYDLNVSGEIATLATQDESAGTLSTVGSCGSGFGGSTVGFAISSTGSAFAALQLNVIDPGDTRLYSEDLATGQLTFIDVIGGDTNYYGVRSIAIPMTAIPEPVSLVGIGLGMTSLAARPRRVHPKQASEPCF